MNQIQAVSPKKTPPSRPIKISEHSEPSPPTERTDFSSVKTPFQPFNPAQLKAHIAAGKTAAPNPINLDPEALSPNRSWRDEVLYFAMTDRFENGDPTNDQGIDPGDPERFHGGDWKGITNRLEDLKDMGVTALWISPVTSNDRDFLGKDGFHGYWPNDFYAPEAGFGSMDDLKELVSEAHKKDMKVLVDLVLNHTGYNHPWTKDPEVMEEKFHDPELHFHKDMVNGSLFGLPDLAQERPEVADYLIKMGKFWAEETNCDGFRLDAIMHFPAEFQQRFVKEMKEARGEDFFILGEAYTGPPERVAKFQDDGDMDSVYDFPLSEALRNVAGYNEDLNFITRRWKAWRLSSEFPGESFRVKSATPDAHQLSQVFAKDSAYEAPHNVVTLVENHDMPRFLTAAGPNAKKKFRQALAVEFTARGIPLLYYGAEDGMGLEKHDLRADKRHGADPEMREYVTKLAHLSRDSVALRRGTQEELHVDKESYAFCRRHPEETVVVAANFRDYEKELRLTLPQPDMILEDALTGQRFEVAGRELPLQLEGRQTAILRTVPNEK